MKDTLYNAHAFNNVIRLGLERISMLLERLERPDKRLKFVHVAGTNGKGSVCSFIEASLIKAGRKTGKFTSPNLGEVNERICVNGCAISDSDLEDVLEKAHAAACEIEREMHEAPTQFEIWCAAAMLFFARQSCDIVVLEVGLGGEFDATNVIEGCELAVICHIDIDHTAYLGNTLEEIARAKCGIIKDNISTRTVVTSRQYPQAIKVIADKTEAFGHTLVCADDVESVGHDGIYEYFKMPDGEHIRLSLGGEYQLMNASCAYAALKALGISDAHIKEGFGSAVHHGRFEMIGDNIIFDGGHNPDGVRALVSSLDRYYPDTQMNIIYACMADKDVEATLSILKRQDRNFIFTTVQDNPRAMTPEQLSALAYEKCGITGMSASNLKQAISLVRKSGRLTVICGSLYLYKDLY